MMKKFYLLIIILISVFSQSELKAQGFKDYFIYEEDESLDVSGFLNSDFGFMPVPILITEPALGFGGGLGAVYFHSKKDNSEVGELPPVMSMVAGAYTANGTWVGLIGHQGSYLEDRIRYTGAVGYVNVNLKYFGLDDVGYRFNMQGFLTFHELMFRPNKKTPFFVGLNYLYFNNNLNFETGIDIPGLENLEVNNNLGTMNLAGMYDTRNNTFTPTNGFMSAVEIGLNSIYLGGDSNYYNFSTRNYFYLPIISDKLHSGYRLNLATKWGDVPFYENPYIDLRGIPLMRYQNSNIGVVETEWRYQVLNRWSIVGFGGVGYAVEKYSILTKDDLKLAGGFGFRYFLAKDYGIHAGIDVARGPEQWAWYLTIGSSWFR